MRQNAARTMVAVHFLDGSMRKRTGRLATDPGRLGRLLNQIPWPKQYR